MDGAHLQDLIQRGLGRAAVAAGAWCDAFRPKGPHRPLAVENRYLKLPAAFSAPRGWFVHPEGYGQAAWWGVFDAAYTRPGDYIVRPESRAGANDGGTWFIAAQQPLLPVLCVRAARVVDVLRPGAEAVPGVGGYGGMTKAESTELLTDWPASVLVAGGSALGPLELPADPSPGSWEVLLPAVPGVVLRPGDLVVDDLGRAAVVGAAELSALGWRLLAKQATT